MIYKSKIHSTETDRRLEHPKHPKYKATGGYLREEAIMHLRRFYMTENASGMFLFCLFLSLVVCLIIPAAPNPKSKVNRVLKTEIIV